MLDAKIANTFVKAEPFPYAAVDELQAEVAPEVVQGLLGAGTVNALGAAPNTGKTFLGIDLAASVAAKVTWFGRKVSGGPVLYVAAEAPGSVRMRARAVKREKYPDIAHLPLYITGVAPALGSELDYQLDGDRLLATVKAIQSDLGEMVRLVVIDTLASVLGGGEENGPGMARVADCARYLASNTEAAILFIHHPSKGDASSLRGHSSLSAAVDTIISITNDEGTGVRTATVTKSRDSAVGAHFEFELSVVTLPDVDSFGDARTTCIIRAAALSNLPRRKAGSPTQEKLLAELERRYRAGETHMDEASVRKAAQLLNVHRNSIPRAIAGLRVGGFIVGDSARMTLKYPPESM